MNDDQEQIERRFLFHAEALGVAAHIRRPKDYFLDSVASSVLAVTGGRAEARAEAGGSGIISYKSAATQAYGDFERPEDAVKFTHGNHGENDLSTRTAVQSIVSGFKLDVPQEHSGLNLFGQSSRTVSAEHLEAMLESTSDRRSPNAFRTLNAVYRGVVIDGRPLIVETNTKLFTDKCTKRKLDCALDDPGFRRSCSNQILDEWPSLILGTVVTRLHWEDGAPPHTEIDRNRLTIHGLGSLYFGEIIIQEGFRRLTLLRFQLGSPDGGEGVVVQADSNGQTSPPQKSGG